MIFRIFVLLFVLTAAPALAKHSASVGKSAPAVFKIDALEARLFYETSGKLSENVATPARFNGWNTIIGEGDAKEPANDLLVTVALSVNRHEENSSKPLVVTVYGAKGKKLARRKITSLFFKDGKVTKAFLAQDVGCAGEGRIEAAFGKEKKTERFKLDCGE